MLKQATRYFVNLVSQVGKQDGYAMAARVGGAFVLSELGKLPTLAQLRWSGADIPHIRQHSVPRNVDWDQIAAELSRQGTDVTAYHVDLEAFRAHIAQMKYPRFYAGGPIQEGGSREQKLLEYFVSLDLLQIRSSDVIIDVASEWSMFPEVIHKLTGAHVYRQDLIYPPGIKGDRIGGDASDMPIPAQFADKLVLHNAFEHFEGSADTEFVVESWRVLKPGGVLCILPLFMSNSFTNLSDPLVNRQGVVWDEGASVIERLWWHNRFGRFYNTEALYSRVLQPAEQLGFHTTIYRVINMREIDPPVNLRFVLMLYKPHSPA